VRTKLLQIAVLAGLATLANAQAIPRPDVPQNLIAPDGEQVVLELHASGSQVYTCQQANDKFAWMLKAPEAELHDERGAIVGAHYAGPTWKYKDGSTVTAKAVAKIDSPNADSIPWLLLTASGHSGDGVLSRVTSIQRIHTNGGQPPAAADCSASTLNTQTKTGYTADYYFYAPAK
jgi:FtsP/CotA-like multicopper oxidase with cupredoxin domain